MQNDQADGVDTPVEPDKKPVGYRVQSFARGLEVIRSFNAAPPGQTLSEMAQRTELTRASALNSAQFAYRVILAQACRGARAE